MKRTVAGGNKSPRVTIGSFFVRKSRVSIGCAFLEEATRARIGFVCVVEGGGGE